MSADDSIPELAAACNALLAAASDNCLRQTRGELTGCGLPLVKAAAAALAVVGFASAARGVPFAAVILGDDVPRRVRPLLRAAFGPGAQSLDPEKIRLWHTRLAAAATEAMGMAGAG